MENGKSSVHQEYYFSEDSACIFKSCSWAQGNWRKQKGTPDGTYEREKKTKLITVNIEKVSRSLREPRGEQGKAASEMERARELTTLNIENITRCLQEPSKRVQGKAASKTERARALTTLNIEEVTRCLQEPSKRVQGKAASKTERARELTTLNIEDVTRCLEEPSKRVQGKAAIKIERARALTTLNIENITRCLEEPSKRVQGKAASKTERAKALTTLNVEDVTRRLQESRRRPKDKATSETERAKAIISDFKRWLEDLRETILNGISSSVSDLIHQLEIKNDELSKKTDPIEELVDMNDPLTVLQESDRQPIPVSDKDTEDGDDEDGERHDELLGSGVGWDKAGVSHTLHTALPDILTGVNGQTDLPEPVDIILDVNTVYNCLHLLDDRKTASWSFINNNLPDTPERFAFRPQALSSQCFSTGRYCWDVEVQGSDNWRVGMCYPSIDRKGGIQSVIGNNKKSWCLSRSHIRYSAIHDRKEAHLFGSISGGTIRVSLDYESGKISFYELGISVRHLHTFTATFTEPLYAVIGVWRGCIKMSGGKSGGSGNFKERSNPEG